MSNDSAVIPTYSSRWLWPGAVALLLLVHAIYAPALHYGFVDYDDNRYVTDNPFVQRGLDSRSVGWAFTSVHASNWHPLTWLSHMTDVELFGLDAGAHHRTNVLFHGLNAALLLLVWFRLSGRVWLSLLVASLFAVHPLRVESVAWISERKDLLAALFWIASVGVYASYVRRGGSLRHAALCALFVLGLLAKPMGVTLPLILLLLDYWPLGRAPLGWRALLREKIPLFALAVASAVTTLAVQRAGGAMMASESWGIGPRLANAFWSYVRYLSMHLWPVDLACFYPHPAAIGRPMAMRATGAALLLSVISIAVWRARRHHPWALVGGGWFAVALLPVIGIVQVGGQAMADRYSYIPSIGLYLIAAWTLARCQALPRMPRALLPSLAVAALCVLALLSRQQLRVWKDSRSLFAHAARVVPGNYLAHHNLGSVLQAAGDEAAAAVHYESAMAIRPDFAPPYHNLGLIRIAEGDTAQAIALFRRAVALDPGYLAAQRSLEAALAVDASGPG